jgi:hypothetical protein
VRGSACEQQLTNADVTMDHGHAIDHAEVVPNSSHTLSAHFPHDISIAGTYIE